MQRFSAQHQLHKDPEGDYGLIAEFDAALKEKEEQIAALEATVREKNREIFAMEMANEVHKRELNEAEEQIAALKAVVHDMDETEKNVRDLCRPYMDVDGDSHGVPGIEDLVKRQIAALQAERDRWDEGRSLREVNEGLVKEIAVLKAEPARALAQQQYDDLQLLREVE